VRSWQGNDGEHDRGRGAERCDYECVTNLTQLERSRWAQSLEALHKTGTPSVLRPQLFYHGESCHNQSSARFVTILSQEIVKRTFFSIRHKELSSRHVAEAPPFKFAVPAPMMR
jgi:hypothetical protein